MSSEDLPASKTLVGRHYELPKQSEDCDSQVVDSCQHHVLSSQRIPALGCLDSWILEKKTCFRDIFYIKKVMKTHFFFRTYLPLVVVDVCELYHVALCVAD